jgi:epsilon-lactone hydrolase
MNSRTNLVCRIRFAPLNGVIFLGLLAFAGCSARQPSNAPHVQTDTSVVGADGTAFVTRVVPVPATISPAAQKVLARPQSDAAAPETLEHRRSHTDEWQNRTGEAFRKLYPVTVTQQMIAGVPTRVITPLSIPAKKQNRVLINLHGGGFNSDSGSLTESIPVAFMTQTKVIAVLYRLAPEHPFPAALDDAVAVYRELLKTYKPNNIAIFGTSAGAILTGEVAVQLRQSGLPLPGALGIFSGMGDFSTSTDSQSLYALNGLSGHLDPPHPPASGGNEYAGSLDLKDPSLSILYADLHGLPSTLFITSGRDMLLSGTTILHRAFLGADVDAHLVVFEALPHAFWNDPNLPETKEANQSMAKFFDKELGR